MPSAEHIHVAKGESVTPPTNTSQARRDILFIPRDTLGQVANRIEKAA